MGQEEALPSEQSTYQHQKRKYLHFIFSLLELHHLTGDKFGDLIYEGREYDVKDQFLTIKELGIDLKGVHFHSGSCHKGSKNFEYSIEMAKKVMKYGR